MKSEHICGLRFDKDAMREHIHFSAPYNFSAPAYVDSRPYCLLTSDQSNNPACAGFATAGYIEVMNWRRTHRAEQIDGLAIYRKAKELDGSSSEGTTLEWAVKGAIALGLLPGSTTMRAIRTAQDVQFALHSHGVAIAGFKITEGWDRPNKQTGYIEDSLVVRGGHAVLLSWYQLKDENYGWQNSWTENWSVNGFGRMTRAQFDQQFQYGIILD